MDGIKVDRGEPKQLTDFSGWFDDHGQLQHSRMSS